jgi:hypothetical protein
MIALSDSQLAAIATTAPGLHVVSSGPGSGKTRMLVQRMVDHLDAGRHNLVAFTFTRRAADEIQRRLRQAWRARTGCRLPSAVFVGTISSWCAALGRRHAGTTSDTLTSRFQVLDERDEEIARKVVPVTRDPYAFQSALMRSDCLHFAGVEEFASHLIANRMPLTDSSIRLDELLVDEAQDLSRTQDRLVRLIGMQADSVFAVGDPRQLIYGWRDADPMVFHRMQTGAATLHAVRDNYRSSTAVVRFATQLSGDLFDSTRTDPGDVQLGVDLWPWLEDRFRSAPSSTAVLGRTWATLHEVADGCRERGIPFRLYSPRGDAWDTNAGRAVCYVIRLANSERPHNEVFARMLAYVIGDEPLLPRAAARAVRQRIHLDVALSELSPTFAAATTGAFEDRVRAVWAPFVEAGVERGDPIERLQLGRWIRPAGFDFESWHAWFAFREVQDRIVDGDHVHLITVHGAKGLEWAHVALPDVSSDVYHRGDPELARLLFVGATRARDSLLLTWRQGDSPSPLLA